MHCLKFSLSNLYRNNKIVNKNVTHVNWCLKDTIDVRINAYCYLLQVSRTCITPLRGKTKKKNYAKRNLKSRNVRKCTFWYMRPTLTSNQPAHPRSLIRVFVVRTKKNFASSPVKNSPSEHSHQTDHFLLILEFNGPLKIIKVMSSRSVDLNTCSWAGLVLEVINQYLCTLFCQKYRLI